MRIHVIEPIKFTAEQKARLENLGEVKYFDGVPDMEGILNRAEGADILAADWSPIDVAIPKMKAGGVKLISVPFTVVGFLPLREVSVKWIKIANAPDFGTESVSEFGVGLMLALVRKIYAYSRGGADDAIAKSLCGKTIGILGRGRIGARVGKLAKSLGMKVVFFKRGGNLGGMLKKADVVYCALPLSDETRGMLGEKEFGMMKSGSYFVTTSHNLIYDHRALISALDKNLAGAALDLEGTKPEDYTSQSYMEFDNNPKILLTPHVAWKTDYAVKRSYDIQIDNIEAFINGAPINIVN